MVELEYNGKDLHLRDILFWDVDKGKLDPEGSRMLIIERVITRGNLQEFTELVNFYSRKELADAVVRIGYLDNRTLNFVSKYFNIPKKEFKCYIKKQSVRIHWNS